MKRMIFLLILVVTSGAFADVRKLSVDECVQIALKQSPDLIREKFTMKIAGREVIVALSSFLPSVKASMGYYHSVVGPSSAIRIDPTTGIPVPLQPLEIVSWNSSAGVNVNQTLFDGQSIFNLGRQCNLKKSAEENYEITKQSTIYIVKERYYNLLAAEKLLEVAEETLNSSTESFKRAEALFEVGTAPKSDVLKAKVLMETDRLGLIEAQNNLAIARASLNHILGFNVDDEIHVIDNLDVPEMDVPYEDAMASAVQYHPSLLKSAFDVKASRAQIGMAASSFTPSVYGFYQYNWRHEDFNRISDIFDKDYNWYLGVSLQLPIFEGFSRMARLSQARLDYRSSQEAFNQIRRDVELELKQSYFDVEQAKKSIAVAQNAVDASDEDLRLNREKYNLGAGTMLDLIDAHVSNTQTKSDYIQALYTYKKAIAALQKAMGRLDK